MKHIARLLLGIAILGSGPVGCQGIGPATATSARPATASPTSTPASTAPGADTPTASAPTATPATGGEEGTLEDGLALYIAPDRLWSVRYDPAGPGPHEIDDDTVLFVDNDGNAFAAVESFAGTTADYGDSGEGLCNRARETLARILGSPLAQSEVIDPQNATWDTGIAYTAASGTCGQAFYAQPGRGDGDFRVYGFLYGYKATAGQARLPLLDLMRDSFRPLAVLPLQVPTGSRPLWAVYSIGYRSFNEQLSEEHFLSVYTRVEGGWQELARAMLQGPDYINAASVQQVQLEPGRIWLQEEGGAGAHGGCFDLFSFDGQALVSQASYCHTSPGAGRVTDVNGDGTPDVVFNETDNYVFCYACSVRYPRYRVLRWDGSRLVEVPLTPLAGSAPQGLQQLTNRAVELAKAGLWKDAQAAAGQAQALGVKNATATWDAAIIRLHAEAFADLVREGTYPLLNNLFYGDYPAALEAMRRYSVAEIWSADTPLVKGTTAEGWEGDLSSWITTTTSQAIGAQPGLAAAYFLHAWGAHLVNPTDPQILADVERAAHLDPGVELYVQSVAELRK